MSTFLLPNSKYKMIRYCEHKGIICLYCTFLMNPNIETMRENN